MKPAHEHCHGCQRLKGVRFIRGKRDRLQQFVYDTPTDSAYPVSFIFRLRAPIFFFSSSPLSMAGSEPLRLPLLAAYAKIWCLWIGFVGLFSPPQPPHLVCLQVVYHTIDGAGCS